MVYQKFVYVLTKYFFHTFAIQIFTILSCTCELVLSSNIETCIYSLPGYGTNELSVPKGWTDFRERSERLLEALPIVIMGYNCLK